MARVALDADVVIAFLDAGDDQHARAVRALGDRLAAGDDILVGASVYAEVMVRPLHRGADTAVDEFLDAIGAAVVPVDRGAAPCACRTPLRSPPPSSAAPSCSPSTSVCAASPRANAHPKRPDERPLAPSYCWFV